MKRKPQHMGTASIRLHLKIDLMPITMFIQDEIKAKLEEAVQKWQTSARKAQRYADACYAEAQAKADEAAEATAQVLPHHTHQSMLL